MPHSAKQLISKRFRVPLGYIERCPGNLQARNLNNWLAYLGHTPLFCRFKDGRIRALLSTAYKPINNSEVMARMLAAYPPETRVELRLSNEMMLLHIPDQQQSFNIKGDNITPGLNFSNSEVGLAAYSCGISYQRLPRSARFIADVAARTRHAKNNGLDNFMAILKIARSHPLSRHKEKIDMSLRRKLRNPMVSIVSFGKHFRLPNCDIRSIQRCWEEERGYTLWHVILAFARMARGEYLPVQKSYRLQMIGGRILANFT